MKRNKYIVGLIGALSLFTFIPLSQMEAEASVNCQNVRSTASKNVKSSTRALAKSHFQNGYALFQSKDYQAAIQDFNIALNIDPSYREVYYYRGLARQYTGDIEGARKDFALSPNDYSADIITIA